MEVVELLQPYAVVYDRPLNRRESLDINMVRKRLLPDALIAYGERGERYGVVNEGNHDLAIQFPEGAIPFCTLSESEEANFFSIREFFPAETERVCGLLSTVLAPWYDYDLMLSFFSDSRRAPALIDIDPALREVMLTDSSYILSEMQRKFGVSFAGENHSMASLKEEDRGLMSCMRIHWHVGSYGGENGNIARRKPKEVIEARNDLTWNDYGLSRIIGERLVGQLLSYTLPRYWPDASNSVCTAADKMGFTIYLPGFTPKDFGKPDFINLWKLLSLTIHAQLKSLHSLIYASDLDEVVNFVLNSYSSKKVDEERYSDFFRLKNDFPDKEETRLLHRLYDENHLRQGFGWAGGLQFYEDGAQVTITLGFGNWKMGPVEGLGLELVRKGEISPPGESEKKFLYFQELASALCA